MATRVFKHAKGQHHHWKVRAVRNGIVTWKCWCGIEESAVVRLYAPVVTVPARVISREERRWESHVATKAALLSSPVEEILYAGGGIQ